MKTHVGLGSNSGDRLRNLQQAVRSIVDRGPRLDSCSSVYETDPIGPPQPDFLNAVCVFRTTMAPREMYRLLKDVEEEVGRTPSVRWGPREIDLDLLLHGDSVVDEPDLLIPHPEMIRRAFVLVPLLEVDPAARMPDGRSLAGFPTGDEGVRLFAGPQTLSESRS